MTTTEHESHCQNCFNAKQCLKEQKSRKNRTEEVSGCPIIRCRFHCSQQFHECKSEEHELLCLKLIVPCINSEFGCPSTMERGSRAIHLKTCPASVVVCTVEWNRKPLPPWQNQPFTFQDDHLDVAAVHRDQKTIIEFRETLPVSLRSLLQTNNRKQPIMPLGVAGHRIPNCILIQAAKEKIATNENNTSIDEDDFSFSESSGGSKKCPPGLKESVCSKLKEVSLAPAPSTIPEPAQAEVVLGNHIESPDLNGKPEEIPADPDPNLTTKSVKKKPDDLSLILDVTSKGACKYMNLYTFMCAREFRRDEYPGHFKSVHNEIMTQLNGWLFTRCPLANYGCSFGIERMFPVTTATDEEVFHVVYNPDVGSFCFTQKFQPPPPSEDNLSDANLCDLPFEVLVVLTKYLDPLSLNALSMTNTLLRSVCQFVVMDRGIVVFDWESNAETGKWEVAGKKWMFSTAFSPLKTWKFADVGLVANHMKMCSHFDELRHRPDRPFSYPVSKEQLD